MSTPPPSSLLFVLGIQRSGTTWVANILDSSPDTLLFMEPFAPAYGLFPEFPETGFFMETAPQEITLLLTEQMQKRLYRKKFLFSPHSLHNSSRFRFERAFAGLATRFSRYLPAQLQRRVAQFNLLNLNRLDRSYPLYPKSDAPGHWVIKELRFAGKIPLLLTAFPDARYLVVIRSPHATVHSMLQWFERGHLGEVRRELNMFVEKLEAQTIGAHYRELIAIARQGSIAHRAALYWRVSYESMIRKLDGSSSFRLLPYEALAYKPTETAYDLFDWAAIPRAPAVTSYLEYSSKSAAEIPGATNTLRQSKLYFSSWEEKITPEIRQAVDEMVDGSFLLKYLLPFYRTGDSADDAP